MKNTYISPNRKGKIAKMGNKYKLRYRLIHAKLAIHIYSKVAIDTADLKFSFSTDSYSIGIYNHASSCISNMIDHFITASTPYTHYYNIGGRGNLNVNGMSTLQCKIEEDNVKIHALFAHT